MKPHENPEAFLATLAGIGALIGLGKLLDSSEKPTPRLVVGRCLISAGTGVAAGSLLMLVPDASPLLLYGAGAAMASLGTSGIEALVSKWRGKE